METITLPFVIKWPAILAPFQAQYQREVQGYKDFLARANNTPKPKTLEQELILISSVLGIAPVAFNVPLVIRGVRDAYYGSLFGFELNYLHDEAISNYANQHGYEYIFRDQYTPVPEHTLNQITQRIISSYWLKLFMVRDVLYREGHVKPIKCRASLGTHVYETVQVW